MSIGFFLPTGNICLDKHLGQSTAATSSLPTGRVMTESEVDMT